MNVKTELSHTLERYQGRETRDAPVKRIFRHKPLLAWILMTCTEEFRDCSYQETLRCLDNCTIHVQKDAVGQDERQEAGTENADANVRRALHDGMAIEGSDTEETSLEEGRIAFDIRFHVTSPEESGAIRIILNVEGQDRGTGLPYEIPERMVYYLSRLISAQKGTIFQNDEYGQLIKVYSIWIVVHPRREHAGSMITFGLKPETVCGHAEYPKQCYDKMAGVILNLKTGIGEGDNEILRLCNTVLSAEPVEKKEKYLQENFQIVMTAQMHEEVEAMTGLQEAAYEEGIRKGNRLGIEQGKDLGIIGAIQMLQETGLCEDLIREKVMRKYNLDSREYEKLRMSAEASETVSA